MRSSNATSGVAITAARWRFVHSRSRLRMRHPPRQRRDHDARRPLELFDPSERGIARRLRCLEPLHELIDPPPRGIALRLGRRRPGHGLGQLPFEPHELGRPRHRALLVVGLYGQLVPGGFELGREMVPLGPLLGEPPLERQDRELGGVRRQQRRDGSHDRRLGRRGEDRSGASVAVTETAAGGVSASAGSGAGAAASAGEAGVPAAGEVSASAGSGAGAAASAGGAAGAG